jgi:hypothetical protein
LDDVIPGSSLEHPVTLVREAQEALLDEGLESVEVGVTHFLPAASSVHTTCEDAAAGEELLLMRREQVVAPPESLL